MALILETDRLLIRELTRDDLPWLIENRSDPEVNKYLGGTRLAALAAARRVDEHTPGALATADLVFAEARAPWCQTFF